MVLIEKQLGLYYDLTSFSAINYINLLGLKMNANTIYFTYFLNELKFKLDTEKTICKTNNTLTQFNKKKGLLY